ncbi:hypothetical protein GGX14DRAFT_459094 [Mycena pura]|uniref:Autophagy-related protein 27 n=1 Tax=Mycena pura TaxID=153505 RepID=A0AAD6V8A4_9AGAR|nr:hypothetical protein GGX14DRAFT_459094 [Mycena pura]
MARPPLHLTWLLCISFLSLALADDKPCTGRHAGKYYDLNRLQTGKDSKLTTPGGHELIISACKAVSHETWRLSDPLSVGGFVRRDQGDFIIGRVNTTLSFSGRAGYPHLTLSSGTSCLDENKKTIENLHGSTEIEFICDPSMGAGSPRLVAQLPPGGDDVSCAWFIEWRTAAACPKSEGWSFWQMIWFLFSSFVVLLVIYIVVGTLYNYFALNLTGTDALPRFSLSGMLYHCREAWDMAGERWASGRGGGFNSSARGPVGFGGGGFQSSDDAERDGAHSNGGANPFIRTRKEPQPQTNPASHQTQVMAPSPSNDTPAPAPTVSGLNPASHQAQSMAPLASSLPAPSPARSPAPAPAVAVTPTGLNPASHQAQLMAGMPVPHLSAPASRQNQNASTQYRDAPAAAQTPTPTRRDTSQTFAVGDDDGDEDGEAEVAEVRGRMGPEGTIRL